MSSMRPRYVVITLLICLFALFAESAFASHFRYGYMFWERNLNYSNPSNPNQVKITVTIETGARWTYTWPAATNPPPGFTQPTRCFNNPTVCCAGDPNAAAGGSDSCPGLGNLTNFVGGSGIQVVGQPITITAKHGITLSTPVAVAANGFFPMDVVVYQTVPVEDTFYGRFVFDILMDKTLPLTLVWNNNARIGNLLDGNANLNWNLQTKIDLTGANANLTKSPKSVSSAVVTVFANQNNIIDIPTVAFDNQVNTFRLATTAESALANPTPLSPSVFTLDANTGRINFTPRTTGFYAVQVIISSKNVATGVVTESVPLDFLFNAVTSQGVYSETLATGDGQTSYTATVPQPFSFTVRSTTQPSNGAYAVNINHGVLPAGATFTQPSCNGSSVCVGTFNWTPTVDSTGSVVCFTSSLTNGQTLIAQSAGSLCVTISLNPLATTMTTNTASGVAGGGPITLSATLKRTLDNAPLPGRAVKFTFDASPTNPPWVSTTNGNGTDTAITDVNGVASLTVPIVRLLPANSNATYTASFSAIANELLQSSASSNAVSIKAATTSVSAPTVGTNPAPSVGFPLSASAVLNRIMTPPDGGIYGIGALLDFTLTGPGGTQTQPGVGPTNSVGSATVTFAAPTAIGDYSATAYFAGSDTLYGDVTSPAGAFKVRQRTQVTVSAGIATQNVSSQVQAVVVAIPSNAPVGAGKTVRFSAPGVTPVNAVTDAAGVATAMMTFPTLGAVTVTAAYTPDGNTELNRSGVAADDSSTATITVQPAAATTTTAVAASGIAGQAITLTGQAVVTAGGAAVPNGGTIRFTVSGQPAIDGTTTNGVASVSYTPATSGNTTFTAQYLGGAGFAASTSAATALTINKASTSLALTANAVAYVGSSLNVQAALTRVSAPAGPANGETISFTLTGPGGSTQTLSAATDASGNAAVNFPLNTRGQFTVAATYTGSSILNPSTQSANITVYQKTYLLVNHAAGYAAASTPVSVALRGLPSDTPIQGQVVTLAFNPVGTTQSAMTDSQGNATTFVNFTNAGSYTATASFNNLADFFVDQNGNQLPTTADGDVQITQAQTALDALQVASTQYVGDQVAVATVLTRTTAPAGAVSNSTVTFTLVGPSGPGAATTTRVATTDSSGHVSTAFDLAARGQYTLTATFDGNAALAASSVSTTFAVYQKTRLAAASVSSPIAGVSAAFTATLTAVPSNTPLALGSVIFTTTAAGVGPVTSSVDANGVASTSLVFPSAATVSITAASVPPAGSFLADRNGVINAADVDAVSLSSVAVATNPATLSAPTIPASGLVGAPVTISTSLTSYGGAAAVGRNITFKVTQPSGQQLFLNGSTQSDGSVSVSFTPSERGVHTVSASYAGDSALTPSASGLATIPVYQRVTLAVAAPPTAPAGQVVSVTASLSTVPGGAAVSGQTVNIAFDGPSGIVYQAAATTSAAGVSTFTHAFAAAGSLQAVASFANLADFFVDANGAQLPSTSQATVVISQATTSLSAVTAPAFGLVSNPVTVSAVLTRTEAPAGPAVGEAVQFTVTDSGGSTILSGNATTDNGGVASFTFTPTTRGAHTIKASYAGGAGLAASTSADSSLAVYQRTTLTVSPATTPSHTPVTISATLTQNPAGATVSGQTVAFSFSDGSWATATTDALGVAHVTQSFNTVGDVTATATFSNAAGFYADSTGAFPVIPTTSTGTVHVTNNAPTFTPPANITAEATGANGAVASFTAGGSDIEDGAIAAVCSPASGSTFPIGSTTVSCTVTDSLNAQVAGGFSVTVQDTTAPTLTLPTVAPTSATSAAGAVVSYTATATDLVDPAPTVACLPASGSIFAIGTTQVTCTATDAHGNVASAPFTVLVTNNAPTFTPPAGMTLEATGSTGAIATFTAAGSDIEDGSINAVCAPASGATFAIGQTMVSCTVTDVAHATASGSFTVTVQDTTAPKLTVPAAVSVSATSASGAVATFTATATDVVDGTVAVSCVPASGSTFAIGNTLVTCASTDAHGNTGTATINVSVTNNAPTFTPPAGMTLEATGSTGAIATFTAAGSDIEDGSINAVCSPASGATFPIGLTTVSCTVTDVAHATASGSFTVRVQDTTAPTVTVPTVANAYATSAAGRITTFTASATDIVDGSVAAVCVPASGSTFPIGTTTVTCSASDTHSNTGTGVFSVTVLNNAPTFTAHANQVSEATGPSGSVVTFTAGGTDVEDGALNAVCTPASGSTFGLGTTTVSCTVTDSRGASATGSFGVTVQDTTKPTLTLPANITVDPTSAAGAPVTYAATASDIVTVPLTPVCAPGSATTFAIGTTVVNCTATDGSNNITTGSFTVTVRNPAQATQNLNTLAVTAGLGTNQVDNVLKFVNHQTGGSLNAACNNLDSVIKKAQKLPAAQGAPVITAAQNLQATIGCTP